MLRNIPLAACAAALSFGAPHAFAQSGSVEKAVGGYSFDEAAAEAPGTKDFHSADGHLTFAIVTHTAGNGFYLAAVQTGQLAIASVLSAMYPVVTVVLAAAVLREPVTRDHTIGIGLAGAAIALIGAGGG